MVGTLLKPENLTRLESIFCAVFELNSTDGVRELRMLTDKRWDSMVTVNLLIAIESEFGIRLDLEEFELLNSFEAAELLLAERGL